MTTDPFLRQLADLCRSDPTGPKWVVVPAHSVGRTLGDRLAREGTSWANLRFVTPFALALDTAAPFLAEAGLDPLPEGLGPSLVMRLLLELPEGTASYFRPLADQPRMGEALWSAIRELRLAGVRAAALPAAAFADARKHEELQALLAAYERHLAEHKQADAADVYRAATPRAAASPVGVGDVLIEAPAPLLPPVARSFLDSLPGRHLPGAVPSIPGLARPRRARSTRRESPAAEALPFLLDPERAPVAIPAERLELFHAAGAEAEVEGVLRRVLAAAPPLPLDQVEVACASREQAHLFWEKARRLDLPVTVEQGVPVSGTRPARAVLGLCAWIDSNFVAGRLRRLLQAGEVRIEFPHAGGGGRAARLLLKSEATWGRETYDRSLAALSGRLIESADHGEELDEEKRADLRAQAAHADHLRKWTAALLALVPLPDAQGCASIADLVAGLRVFLREYAGVADRQDGLARAAIEQALADLLALGSLRRPVRQLLALVRNALDGLAIEAAPARPGCLHVAPLASAGRAGRAFTFVVGLREGGVFPPLLEDPVLLDAERQAISAAHGLSPALATSHDRLAEAVHAIVSRLAVLPLPAGKAGAGRICLSYSCRDLRDGRETFPSWLMLQALRLRARDASLTYDDLRQRLGTPETLVPSSPGEALTDAGWWLATLQNGAGEKAVLDAFPPLAAGRTALDARESPGFTEWDGLVPAARDTLDPRVSGKPVSVTRLERLAGCPFRYFLEHGLGLEVVDDGEPDEDQWLDPLQKGVALHEVYATLGREARERGTRLQPRRDGFRARQLADEILRALREACPPPSDVVFDRERAEFLRDVELFLQFEADGPATEPVAFEVAFGHAGDGIEPLTSVEPIEIPLGGGARFRLRGTIDRVDRQADGSYLVIDYKTGRYVAEKWAGTFRGGTLLQHALYGVAAASLLRRVEKAPRIAGALYEFPSAAGGGERQPVKPVSQGLLAAVLTDLFDVIAEGAFVAAQDEKECRFCDFAPACGNPAGPARLKLENPHNAMLEPYRRLRKHE